MVHVRKKNLRTYWKGNRFVHEEITPKEIWHEFRYVKPDAHKVLIGGKGEVDGRWAVSGLQKILHPIKEFKKDHPDIYVKLKKGKRFAIKDRPATRVSPTVTKIPKRLL